MNSTTEQTTLDRLCEWLAGCGMSKIHPVSVRIGKREWTGARYVRTGKYTADMQACQWGKRKPGETYTENFVYLLGNVPKHSRECFPNAADNLDWYVAAFMPEKNLTPQNAEFHPFGVSFMLAPWNIPDSQIDEYEPKPYKRTPVTIQDLPEHAPLRPQSPTTHVSAVGESNSPTN